MKRKILTGLTLAASLLLYSPAFAKDHKDKKNKGDKGNNGHHAESVNHRGNGAHAVAVSRPVNRERISNGNGHHSNDNYSPSNASYRGGGNNNHGTYAFASHSGWNRGNEYNWSGHHYRWYNNAWFIIGPAYGSNYTQTAYYATGRPSVGTNVQAALARQGYYRGPIDGLVGPVTRSAIAAYQRDNGLSITGTINSGLINNLGI